MNKLIGLLVLFMLMSMGNNSYACDWIRLRHYQSAVIVQPQPVQTIVWTYASVPTVVYQPVVVNQPVLVPLVPVVEQNVMWGWPNYYTVSPIRPTYIRY